MNFKRRARIHPAIPTASMADIAMLLLIFFMSTSIIRSQTGAAVRLPGATAGQRIHAEEAIRVSIDPKGRVSLNDAAVAVPSIGPLLAEKLARSPDIVITLYADARTPYTTVAAVLDQLKMAKTQRVTLATRRRGKA